MNVLRINPGEAPKTTSLEQAILFADNVPALNGLLSAIELAKLHKQPDTDYLTAVASSKLRRTTFFEAKIGKKIIVPKTLEEEFAEITGDIDG